MTEKTKKLKIVKSNSLVQAKYRLTVQEQRLILLAISQLNRHEELTDQQMYSVYAKDMANLTETSLDQTYDDLRKSALRLKRREVTIYEKPNSEGDHDEILIANWVQTVKYVKKQGRVDLRFNHDIIPYLNQLKITESFTEFLLNGPNNELFKMTSSYGYRIFELLMQWKNVGKRSIEIDWLKHTLELPSSYDSMTNLKRRVITPAIKDINDHTPYWVKLSQQKSGTVITHFVFTFGLKEDLKPKKKTVKDKKITKADLSDPKFLSKHARPGESKDQAIRRLKEQFSI